jgi:hypothetical protein
MRFCQDRFVHARQVRGNATASANYVAKCDDFVVGADSFPLNKFRMRFIHFIFTKTESVSSSALRSSSRVSTNYSTCAHAPIVCLGQRRSASIRASTLTLACSRPLKGRKCWGSSVGYWLSAGLTSLVLVAVSCCIRPAGDWVIITKGSESSMGHIFDKNSAC